MAKLSEGATVQMVRDEMTPDEREQEDADDPGFR